MSDLPTSAPAPGAASCGDAAPHVLIFGLGYSMLQAARRLRALGWRVSGTVTSMEKAAILRADHGIRAFVFRGGEQALDQPAQVLDGVTHVISSVPPMRNPTQGEGGQADQVLAAHGADLLAWATAVPGAWLGYLSTTGVYGNHDGAEVDEDTPPAPTGPRTQARWLAEQAWMLLADRAGGHCARFRISGIYGPGRSVLDRVQAAEPVPWRLGHVFNRILVDDLVTAVVAGARLRASGVFNLSDHVPADRAQVSDYAAQLMGAPPPEVIPFEVAAESMSPMALSFWRDNRRVRSVKTVARLGIHWSAPSYVEGLRQLWEQRDGPMPAPGDRDHAG